VIIEHHDTVVIGGGQAGLTISHGLSQRGIDHVVLERGRLAERWRSERWDSLRMLTPNWMSRLPGRPGEVTDPDGFMSKDDLVDLLESYAASFASPLREGVDVTGVESASSGFAITTNKGSMWARNVVVATGQCGRPALPGFASAIDPGLHQIHASQYRNPSNLPSKGVLVVGAGASGIQIAAELQDSGRQVALATGKHARAVRRYRGKDLWWWLESIGSLDESVDEVADVEAARRTPSLGLTGAEGGHDIDLGSLQRAGVRVAGRMLDGRGSVAMFAANVPGDVETAELRLRRLLDRFDEWATEAGLDGELTPPLRPVPVRVSKPIVGGVDLVAMGIETVVWSTGYRQSYPWLKVPVLSEQGEFIHRRGVTEVPGLFVLGLRFQWRRGSHFVDGVGRDAEYLAGVIADRRTEGAVA
jgi:putative flavoprotein involved in K+ transport